MVRDHETVRYRKDGTPVEVSLTGSPIMDSKGNIIGLCGIYKDITESKRAQREIVEMEEFLERLVGAAGDGIICADSEGIITIWNPAMEKIYGYSAEEAMGRSFEALIVPEERRRELKEVLESLDLARPSRNFKTQRKRRDGSLVWVSLTIAGLFDNEGMRTGSLGIHRDISDIKRADEEIRRLSEFYQNLVGSAGDAIVAVDRDLRVTVWNRGAKRMFGYSRQEALGQPNYTLMGGPDEAGEMEHIGHRMLDSDGKEPESPYEGKRYRKDGTPIWVSVTVSQLRDAEGRVSGLVSILKDMTDRKDTEEKLTCYRERLRSLASKLSLAEERERRRIAVELHGYIGQKLVTSRMKLQLLRKTQGHSALSEELSELIQLLGEAIEGARHLTFELSPPIMYEVGLEAALRWLVKQHAKQHGVKCHFKDDGQLKPLEGDVRVVLFQSARELLINAAKHAGSCRIKVSIRRRDSDIIVRVEDDGIGFDTTRFASGWHGGGGFGLFSIAERIGYLGGRFELNSEPGKGTRATLVAPLKSEG